MRREDREFDKFHNGARQQVAQVLEPGTRVSRPLRPEETRANREARALFFEGQTRLVRHHSSKFRTPKQKPSPVKVTYHVNATVCYRNEVVIVAGSYGVLQVVGVPQEKRTSVESAAARHYSLGVVGDFSLHSKWAVSLSGPQRFQVEA